jgi:hypothetical protein
MKVTILGAYDIKNHHYPNGISSPAEIAQIYISNYIYSVIFAQAASYTRLATAEDKSWTADQA